MLIAASSPSTRFFVPRRRAVRAPRHDPPPPPESDGSNGPLSRPLRAGGGHPGCQLYRVVHSRSEATRTCQYGRLRDPGGGAERPHGRRRPNPAGAESHHTRQRRALGYSGFVATISHIFLISAFVSPRPQQSARSRTPRRIGPRGR